MSQTYGKTSWKRFAVVMVPTVAATAAVGISMAQGALAASFAVSGVHATISAKDLTGSGFNQYGSVDGVMDPTTGKPVNTPVAVSGFTTAHITNLCQSVVVPLPFTLPGGEKSVTMTITGGDNGKTVDASNIILDMDDLKADSATFGSIQIGRAAGTIDQGPVDPSAQALPGFGASFAQQAKTAALHNVLQSSYATSADTFTLTNMHLGLAAGSKPCTQPHD